MFNFKYVSGRFTAITSPDSKRIYIEGPDDFGLNLKIDHDDVPQEETENQTAYLCRILDKYWFPIIP